MEHNSEVTTELRFNLRCVAPGLISAQKLQQSCEGTVTAGQAERCAQSSGAGGRATRRGSRRQGWGRAGFCRRPTREWALAQGGARPRLTRL